MQGIDATDNIPMSYKINGCLTLGKANMKAYVPFRVINGDWSK